MNVLIQTSDGPRVLSPREAAMRLHQVEHLIAEAKRAPNVDELALRRLQNEAKALYAITNPEVAYDEVIYE